MLGSCYHYFHSWRHIIQLQFENDSDIYDTSINRFSQELAQLGKHSREYDWKNELGIGDEIDVIDKAKVWYHSTIIDFKEHKKFNGRSWILILVGFRIYTSTGTK